MNKNVGNFGRHILGNCARIGWRVRRTGVRRGEAGGGGGRGEPKLMTSSLKFDENKTFLLFNSAIFGLQWRSVQEYIPIRHLSKRWIFK